MMWKRQLLSVAILILSLDLISLISYWDNTLREEAMAEAYLKKIWIVSDWEDEVYKDIYFSFDKIENQECEGGFGIGGIYRFGGSDHLREADNRFSGTIDGNIAECRFVDYEGRVGRIFFVFINENEIEATISYDGEATIESKSFRPYNIQDINCFTVQEESTVQVNLDHWGRFIL